MNGFQERLLRWIVPPAAGRALGNGQIARGLAAMKGVGCPRRGASDCHYGRDLFACADCDVATTMPPTMRAAPTK
jgi:hypothetical protein